MRVLMYGWEFPPHISGGLGTACFGMTQGLAQTGTEVIFVLPSALNAEQPTVDSGNSTFQLKSASGTIVHTDEEKYIQQSTKNTLFENVSFQRVDSLLTPYATQFTYSEDFKQFQKDFFEESSWHKRNSFEELITLKGGYGKDLISEVYRYAKASSVLALREDFDVIHAHDWMTFPAGVLTKILTGKPLVLHVHATEFDRTGELVNPQLYDIECYGLKYADLVIAVSHRTRKTVIERYGVDPSKVHVVHNAVTKKEAIQKYQATPLKNDEKWVLFMGRVTFQKGPDYFVEAAKLVLEKMDNVRFIMAGNGDMMERMIKRVSQLKIGSSFHFPGFMRAEDVDKMYALADVYVMPSVSEPFGIAPLEAIVYDTPVIMSHQSGVGEVIQNSVKVNFWDVEEMASKICAMLSYPALSSTVVKKSHEDLKKISWYKSAQSINSLYYSLIGA